MWCSNVYCDCIVTPLLAPLSAESLIAVRRQQTFLEIILGSTCWRGGITCLASGHHLRRLILHASAVSMSKFRMLTRWNRVRSSGCGLHNMPPISKLRLPLVRGHLVNFRGSFSMFSYFLWFFVFMFLRRVATVSLVPSVSTTFEIFPFFPFFPEMMFCSVVLLASLVCQTLSRLANANR